MPSPNRSARLIAAIVLAASLPVAISFGQGAQPSTPTQRPTRPAPKPKTPTTVPDEAPKQPTQPGDPNAPATTPAKPGSTTTPGTSPVKGAPEVGPYLTREAQKMWTLKAFIRLNSDRPDQFDQPQGVNPTGKQTLVPKITPFKATKVAVVFPGLDSTASSDCRVKRISGVLKFDDQVVDDEATVMTALYHSGVKLIRLESEPTANDPETTIRDVNIEYVIPVTCYSTKYNEAAAEQVPWPTGAWPVEAASTLTPQLFVDMAVGKNGHAEPFTEEAGKMLQETIDRALAFGRVKNPKDVTPARLAKLLTRQIWQDIQVSGTGKVARPRTGEFAGLDMQDPAQTLMEKRGDVHDITALTAAIFRKAGLPTRTVIGIDMYAEKGAAFLKEEKASRELRSWVEFAVYDEAKNTINWIPIDIPRMRKQTSRPTDINKPWKFFGSHEELNSVIPFAFHFHPPTDVVAYRAPGFWGWYVEPTAPKNGLTAIRFDAQQAANRGVTDDGDDKDDKDKKGDKDDKKKDAPKRRY